MTNVAIVLALGALLLYGGWAVSAGVATRSLSPVNAVLLSYVASLAVVGGYVLVTRRPVVGTRTDVGFALLSGVLLAVATISFYAALTHGNMAIVSAISALYFVIPAIVGVLYFDAQLATTNVLGLGLAVVAVVLVAA
ncbi:EamA family transporter [Haloterrigena salifodinae]|uniref:EamA family transporter n=1 Tax=Haloterrigena salifodinae TaxID=2675099 RepID=UPI000F876382|nr:EamA family transporter [Haloterrigena salifodinae]